MATLIRNALAAVLILAIGSATPLRAQVPAPSEAAAARLAAAAPLIERARAEGRTRVIVELAGAPALSAATALTADALAAQETMVAAAQADILAGLALPAADEAVTRFRFVPGLALSLDEGQIAALAADPRVVALREDALSRPMLGQSTALIGATTAWSSGFTGSGWTVAILDTGVDRNHPFLAGRVVDEGCFSTTSAAQGSTSLCPNGQNTQLGTGASADCTGASGCGHGTHVAGIAAGQGTSFHGVARGASIMGVQVFSRFSAAACGGSPCVMSWTSDQIRGLEHVFSRRTSRQIAAANMSLGGGRHFTACDGSSQKLIIDQLRAAGIATVIASGNNGFFDSISSPACISSSVSVGAITKQGAVTSFSNSAQILTMLAPGALIESSVPPSGYAAWSGTSMAAPHVAGAFAVIRHARPNATVSQIVDALRTTGTPIADARNGITRSMIRPDLAINAIAGPTPTPAGTLAVSPNEGFAASGTAGGPFTPTSRVYTLTNTGSAALNFTASSGVAWATATPSSGTIAAGGSTSVTVAIGTGASALAAGSYSGAVSFTNASNGNGSTTRSLALTVSAPTTNPLPNNDKFENAVNLVASVGSTAASNVGASKENGEPAHGGRSGGRSVWWRWTAPQNGQLTVTTLGSNFDTLLGVYAGVTVATLTTIGGNDDSDGGLQSRVQVPVQAGVTYRIAVDGFGAATGSVVLNWSFIVDSQDLPSLSVSPLAEYTPSGPSGGPFAPSSMQYTLTNTGTSALNYTVSDLPAWLTASPASGTIQPSASASVTLSINAATANALAPGAYSQTIRFNGVTRSVRLTALAPPITNDNFTAAAVLTGASATATGTNVGATREPGEPVHAGVFSDRSVWWRWTAPATGAVQISTAGSNFDTVLAVYSGGALGSLVQMAANDDAGNARQSRVSLNAQAGTTYHVAVDGYGGDTGSISLSVGAAPPRPDNDDFAAAAVLTGGSGLVTGNNEGAGRQTGEPDHAGRVGGRSVWWRWTAPTSNVFTFDTLGSGFDTLLAVYTGSAVNGLSPVAGNDDTGSTLQSSVSFAAVAGTTYHIAVDGYDGDGGPIALRYSSNTPILRTAVLPYSRAVQVGSMATAFAALVNDGQVAATGCRLELPPTANVPGSFIYQATDPASNVAVGFPNTPVDVLAGQTRTFVFGIAPTAAFNPREVGLRFICNSTDAAAVVPGLNTLILSAAATQPMDLVSIAATPASPGIVDIPGPTGISFFAVAAVNLGASGTVTATAEASSPNLPLSITLCQTNPQNGQCLATPAAQVSATAAQGQTITFTAFVRGTGTVPFDPAANRIFFRLRDGNGHTRGATNVAVRTVAPAPAVATADKVEAPKVGPDDKAPKKQPRTVVLR